MVDPDVVARRLLALGEALRELDGRLSDITVEGLTADALLRAAVERWLQVAVESCIDIAYHVVAERGWTPPETAREAFALLAAHSVVPGDLARSLGRAAGLRNILVHDYVRVDLALLSESVRSALRDLQAFGALASKLISVAD
ncbi:MAG: DUF86 domain-containing protein [Polyangiales bacterium]